ncbi:phosphodiester glycosidase family protein [Aquimarina sp. RZ0]|uniref:phosphodiester glycosidase family protein n=1 Tax=Aquimarina sp. RZ0 TaxID=2607730 RepID=UPI0011F3C6E4|nr:phosphodiester glycosidase family protein [Aquimarina sp. RZ0]KAA1245835.1 phosphodiester glycosidase family protein [Aquimarina sp. RZ0]
MIIKEIESDFLIEPVFRTKEELFSDTVSRVSKEKEYSFIINVNFYDLTYAGKLDALNGHDPVAAKETIPLGRVVFNKKPLTGTSANLDFYIASKESTICSGDDFSKVFQSGQGDTPSNSAIGFGGLGALILNGLEYGHQNKYKKGAPKNAILKGEPSSEAKKFLIQRSSNKYTSFSANDKKQGNKLGKTCLGISKKGIYVVVQQHGSPRWSVQKVKDYFKDKKCVHAVFFDGSDSSMLYEKGSFLAKQGENKDETCVIGIGFKKLS